MATAYRNARASMQSPELQPCELRVLYYLTLGYKNKQIAAKLGVTVSSVKQICVNIFNRLGVDNRVQAALVAMERKLLDRWLDLARREREVSEAMKVVSSWSQGAA